MRVLDRLVGSQFLRLFIVAILATPPLFILGELTEDLDRYVDLGLTTADVLRGYVFRLPEYVVWSSPIAGLVAAVFTVHSMTTHREIVAAKAGGVSFYRLVLPIFLLAATIAGGALAMTEVVPRSNRIAFRLLGSADPQRDWRTDFVFQTERGWTLAARRLTLDDRRMNGVLLQKPATTGVPAMHVQATMAIHEEERGWILHDGFARVIYEDGAETAYAFSEARVPSLVEEPNDLIDDPPENDEMTYAELDRMARVIERSGGDAHELRVTKEQRRAIPIATLVVVVFGTPLATTSKRGGTAYGIGVALGTTIVYLLMLEIFGGFGSAGAISPLVAAWTPNLVFLTAGGALLVRVRT